MSDSHLKLHYKLFALHISSAFVISIVLFFKKACTNIKAVAVINDGIRIL